MLPAGYSSSRVIQRQIQPAIRLININLPQARKKKERRKKNVLSLAQTLFRHLSTESANQQEATVPADLANGSNRYVTVTLC